MGPSCAYCAALYPDTDPRVHESCADASVFEESGGWMFLGRTVPLEEMPG